MPTVLAGRLLTVATEPGTTVSAYVVVPKAPIDTPLNVTIAPATQRPRAMRVRSNIFQPPDELAVTLPKRRGGALGNLAHPACSLRMPWRCSNPSRTRVRFVLQLLCNCFSVLAVHAESTTIRENEKLLDAPRAPRPAQLEPTLPTIRPEMVITLEPCRPMIFICRRGRSIHHDSMR